MTKVNLLEHIYTCTEEAATKLEHYIQQVNKQFQQEPEIIRDIELGIIEQLDLILKERTNKKLTLVDVEFLIQKMLMNLNLIIRKVLLKNLQVVVTLNLLKKPLIC